jgi:hypothetical protein
MEYVIGFVLAVIVGVSTTWIGMAKDRALYPAVLIVVASYYELFAVLGGSTQALIVESAVAVIFVGLAFASFRSTLWLAVIGLAGHGLFDLVHTPLVHNPGVPVWWPMFCFSYDVAAAAFLALLIYRNDVRSHAS